MTLAIEAPTDAQIAYIRDLCVRQRIQEPEAIHSKQEASEIIGAMRGGTYDPARYRLDADLPEALRPN